MPVLKGLKLSTGTICVIRGFDSAYDFQAELSLGSKLAGDIKADDTYLTMATGSSATLDGSCNKLVLDASGGSSANLDDLKATDATVKLGSGSNATVSVSGIMNVDLSSVPRFSTSVRLP
jgi:hypothetical protein